MSGCWRGGKLIITSTNSIRSQIHIPVLTLVIPRHLWVELITRGGFSEAHKWNVMFFSRKLFCTLWYELYQLFISFSVSMKELRVETDLQSWCTQALGNMLLTFSYLPPTNCPSSSWAHYIEATLNAYQLDHPIYFYLSCTNIMFIFISLLPSFVAKINQ